MCVCLICMHYYHNITRTRRLKMKLLVFAFLFTVSYGCKLPQRTWCDSVKNAIQCDVLNQCKRYVWYIGTTEQDAPKVKVDLYYESLCPFCRMFMTKQLYPTYKLLGDIMDISLYPYGNAKTCSIALLKDFDKYFEFINCMESGQENDPVKSAERCGKNIDLNSIMKCANSSLGVSLEHRMAAITNQLNPPHKYVPWININGMHSDAEQQEAQQNLAKIVCEKYTGIKPDPCMKLEVMPDAVCPRE